VGPIFLGIAGGSCSGKTTLVSTLVSSLPYEVTTLTFDSYYCDQGHLPMKERALVNYDHPDSLDVSLFISDLRTLRSGKPVSTPIYDFATHTRQSETVEINGTEIVLIDGILLLVFQEVCELLDLKIFVEAPQSIRSERRIIRDASERGRSPEQARAQFLRTVQPMHEKFVEPSMVEADLVINGESNPLESAQQIQSVLLNAKFARPDTP